MPVNMYKVLKELMSAPAVTGFEEPRRKKVIEQFSKYCDTVSVDVIGNVVGTIGSGERAVMLAGHVLLTRTVFGRHVFAVGSSAETARLCGVNVGRIQVYTFLLSGLCAAMAGFVFWVRQGTGDPLAGDGLELYAIAAVIVGGTSLTGGRGSIIGTFLGAIIMGVLGYGLLFFGVPTPWQWVIIGSVVIVTVLVDRL